LRWLLTWSGGTATAPTCGSAGISSASAWATRREPPGAFWLAFHFLNRGDFARGGGWLARARRLLDDGQHDCAEQIAEVVCYCSGEWDEELRARHAAEAPMVRP